MTAVHNVNVRMFSEPDDHHHFRVKYLAIRIIYESIFRYLSVLTSPAHKGFSKFFFMSKKQGHHRHYWAKD